MNKMNLDFKTHDEESRTIINGTCLQGYIHAHYRDLIKKFGEPGTGDGYKLDAEWIIEFEDGTVASVYNWKNGLNYCGNNGIPVEHIYVWHIGGKNGTNAVTKVKLVLNTKEK